MKKGVLAGIIIIVAGISLIILILFLMGTISITGDAVSIKFKNCHDVSVPYQEIESYTETIPYTDQECEAKPLVYKIEGGLCNNKNNGFLGFGRSNAQYSCTITNLDDVGGVFYVNIGFNVQGQPLSEDQSRFLYPQSSQTFSIERDADVQNCFCKEQAPTKQVCRDVIKYKDVQKTRTITKYKTESQCD